MTELARSKPLVLVVDHDAVMRDRLCKLLLESGCHAVPVTNGRNAMIAIRDAAPELVFIDLRLPDMSGMDLVENITRGQNGTVVVVKGYGSAATLGEAMRKGAYDCLDETFDRNQFGVVLERGLDCISKTKDSRQARSEREHFERYFITFVCHELHSPIAAVQQYLEVLKDLDFVSEKEKVSEIIIRSEKRLNRLHELIERWLEVSRIEAGAYVPEYSDFPADELFAEVLEDLESSISERGQIWKCFIEKDCPLIRADHASVFRVMINLVRNASKYTLPGGELGLCCGYDNRYINIAVRDNGQGIAPEQLPLVFEPFFRAGNNGYSEKGYGLGLCFCKRIMEAHGGTIKVVSEPGKGSVFTLCFPR